MNKLHIIYTVHFTSAVCLKICNNTHCTLNGSGILTQSVHIPTRFGVGHHHHKGIHLVSYNTAVETVLSCYALTIQSSSRPLSRKNLVNVVRCATSLALYSPMMMVVANTETCRNMDWLCKNFRIIKCVLCLLLEIFRQIARNEQFILQSSLLPLLVLLYVCAFWKK